MGTYWHRLPSLRPFYNAPRRRCPSFKRSSRRASTSCNMNRTDRPLYIRLSLAVPPPLLWIVFSFIPRIALTCLAVIGVFLSLKLMIVLSFTQYYCDGWGTDSIKKREPFLAQTKVSLPAPPGCLRDIARRILTERLAKRIPCGIAVMTERELTSSNHICSTKVHVRASGFEYEPVAETKCRASH